MTVRSVRGCLWLCTLLFSISIAAGPPPEAFGALPLQTDCVLSEDGRWLAWIDHADEQPKVMLFDLSTHKMQRILGVPKPSTVRSLWWHDNETLLLFVSETTVSKDAARTSGEWDHVIAEDVSGGPGRILPENHLPPRVNAWLRPAATLVAARTAKPKTILMASKFVCGHLKNCLLDVDVRTGAASVVKIGNEYTTRWIVDRAGNPVAREDWDWRKHAYRLYALDGNNIREILRHDDSSHPLLAGLLADGSAVVMLATNGRAHQAAWALPLDGSPARLLVEDPDADITSTFTDLYTGAIIGVYVSGSKTTVRWLDPAAQRRSDLVQRAFPNKDAAVYGWTADGTKTLARVDAASSPPVYYLIDFATKRADIAAEEYPALANVPLGGMQELSYAARDGTSIPAYLTLPLGSTSRPFALVVFPHGGPQLRDYPRFNWFVQFLVSRGYAVLQPEFRGSTGFGDAFREAGYRQWGGVMQDDVTDGVRAMIERGIADPHRICIVGQDYGGYVALAGAAFTPDLYTCAVSINGITDLPRLMREDVELIDVRASTALSAWKERFGSPHDGTLSTRSPINAVKAISIPVLMLYGPDAFVPIEQSQRMVRALQEAGKNVTAVALPGEDHWTARTATRVQVLQALESFLKEHL